MGKKVQIQKLEIADIKIDNSKYKKKNRNGFRNVAKLTEINNRAISVTNKKMMPQIILNML
jgi:hypothetical protein